MSEFKNKIENAFIAKQNVEISFKNEEEIVVTFSLEGKELEMHFSPLRFFELLTNRTETPTPKRPSFSVDLREYPTKKL